VTDFSPGGISVLFRDIKVCVSKMDRASGAFLARMNHGGILFPFLLERGLCLWSLFYYFSCFSLYTGTDKLVSCP
jgi:hypothetical protein